MVAKEVKLFAELARTGAVETIRAARESLAAVPASKVPLDWRRFPVAYGLTGRKIEGVEDCREHLETAESLIGPSPVENPWLPYLGTGLDAGIAWLLAAETITALSLPAPGYLGFPSDDWIKTRVGAWETGKVSFALAVGEPPEKIEEVLAEFGDKAVDILATGEKYKDRGDNVFALSGEMAGHAVSFGILARAALMNGVAAGDYRQLLEYCRANFFGFVALFADESPEGRAIAAAGVSFGLATIVREYTPQLLPVYSVPRF
ncbi:MAG: hypothetical protein ACYC1U_10815 [Candidatus Aquicultorales bacterium]